MAENLVNADNTDTYVSFIGTTLMVLIVLMFISLLLVIISRFFG